MFGIVHRFVHRPAHFGAQRTAVRNAYLRISVHLRTSVSRVAPFRLQGHRQQRSRPAGTVSALLLSITGRTSSTAVTCVRQYVVARASPFHIIVVA